MAVQLSPQALTVLRNLQTLLAQWPESLILYIGDDGALAVAAKTVDGPQEVETTIDVQVDVEKWWD